MGLFDDIIGIAKEFRDVKDELASTVSQVVKDATDLRLEAVDVATQLKQEASSSVEALKGRMNDTKDSVVSEFTKRPPIK